MNIVETIRAETAAHRSRVAVADGEVEATYGELLAAVDEVAGALRDAGVAPGRRVAFLCEDSLDYIIGSLAVLSLSAALVPVSPTLMADEVDAVLDRIDVHLLLFEEGTCRSPDARPLGGKGFRRKRFSTVARQARDALPPEYHAMEPAFIRFSSGTTGASKGVVLSHRSIAERTDAADKGLAVTAADVVMWVLSMSFHFVATILLFLRRGATIVVCGQSFPDSFVRAVARRRGTLLYASPYHYQTLISTPSLPRDALASVRLAVSTAVKMPAATAGQFKEKFGFGLAEAYGIIEVGLPFVNADPDRAETGCVGRVLPDYRIRIASPDASGDGEILIAGAGMFDAYFSPWQTRDQIVQDGWFNTEDMGRVDDDGRLFIVGRKKNVINFAGMKIFPYEVEEVLNQHPSVGESLVYGVPHPLYGQLPCAKIVPRAGVGAPDLEDLRRFCYRRLATYKVPKEFECVDAIPRTASGKLRR